MNIWVQTITGQVSIDMTIIITVMVMLNMDLNNYCTCSGT